MIEITTVSEIGQHKPAYVLSLRISADLIEKGCFLWGPSHDRPAIVAMEGTKCVGYITYVIDPEVDYFEIDVAGVDPEHRAGASTFILMLSKLRDVIKESKKKYVRFLYHDNNPHMKDAARILGGRIRSYNVEIKAEDID